MSRLFCCSAKEEDDENEGGVKNKKKVLVERSRNSDIFEELKKRRLVPAISFMFLHPALPFTPPSPPPL